jgi:hypothetical protein
MATHECKLGGHDNDGDKLSLRALTLAQTTMRVGQEEGVGYDRTVGKANRVVVAVDTSNTTLHTRLSSPAWR